MARRTNDDGDEVPSSGKGVWLGIFAVLLLAVGAYLYLKRTAPASPAPVATEPAPAPAPAPPAAKHIYSETANPQADIDAALEQARRDHKRVLIDFGGDWCGDCQVLDIYFHEAPNAGLLQDNFVLVHVWVGHMDANLDLAKKYGVPIEKGVPALAVLAPTGKVLYAQSTGQFRDMRHMEPDSVTEFLVQWKS